MSKTYFVYIMASQKNGTTYIGVTNDIVLRSTNHRDGKGSIFTKRNRVQRLVYYEPYTDVREAIAREKQLKKWNRAWKVVVRSEPVTYPLNPCFVIPAQAGIHGPPSPHKETRPRKLSAQTMDPRLRGDDKVGVR